MKITDHVCDIERRLKQLEKSMRSVECIIGQMGVGQSILQAQAQQNQSPVILQPEPLDLKKELAGIYDFNRPWIPIHKLGNSYKVNVMVGMEDECYGWDGSNVQDGYEVNAWCEYYAGGEVRKVTFKVVRDHNSRWMYVTFDHMGVSQNVIAFTNATFIQVDPYKSIEQRNIHRAMTVHKGSTIRRVINPEL